MSRVLLWVSFFTFSNSCNCLILIGSLCCTVKLERKEALFYVEKSIQWTTFKFSFSWWWESSVHHIRKLFNRLLAHYIFMSQAYNPHFSLYWSLKWNLSQLIVYIASKFIFFLEIFCWWLRLYNSIFVISGKPDLVLIINYRSNFDILT